MLDQTLTNRTVYGFIWLFTGTNAQAVLQLVVMIILARLLTPVDFGVVGMAMVVVGFSQIFSQLGVGPAIVQIANLSKVHIKAGFTLSVMLSCFVGMIILLSAPLFARFFRMTDLQPVIQVLALVFPITGLSVIGEALLQRDMQFKKLAIINMTSYALGYGTVGVVFALSGWGVWSLVFAQIGQAAIKAIIILLLKQEAVGFVIKSVELKRLLNFGTGLSLYVPKLSRR